MNTLLDINIEDYKSETSEKITVTGKIPYNHQYTEIKCFKNFDDVSNLEARKINLIKIQKSVFLNLSNLQEIDLRENKLYKITKKFLNLKFLKILKLDDNLISYLPCFISNLESLEQLTLSNNQIKNIPTSIQNLQNLKILKFSNNRIDYIPIEFGYLKSLEILHMDTNYFTQIPTTLCYLKYLSELSLEWLEFTDPPLQKTIKDNIGKTIITLMRNSLLEMLKQNLLYCDFHDFVSRNSIQGASSESNKNTTQMNPSQPKQQFQTNNFPSNSMRKESSENTVDMNTNNMSTNQNLKILLKIFYAIENNYYGVIKSLINSSDDYLKMKNNDNKTPLYLTIHNNKTILTRLILTKIDFSTINNSYTYLHKAIRMRDAALAERLIEMGINVNESDDQGSTCFHILFSVFTKNFAKCSLIGDMLLRKNCKKNVLNNEHWAPVHVASKRGTRECLQWIINQNKILKKEGKEYFDLNIKGKNKCTPLHISVICFRLEETSLLLEAGCDVFAKNQDGKSSRNVCYGNFLLSKLLRNYENSYLSFKFPQINDVNNITNNYFTTLEENTKVEDSSSNILRKSYFSSNINSRWMDQYNSIDFQKQNLLKMNYDSSNYNTAQLKISEIEGGNTSSPEKKYFLKNKSLNDFKNYKSSHSRKEIPKIPKSHLTESGKNEKNLNSNNNYLSHSNYNSCFNILPIPINRKISNPQSKSKPHKNPSHNFEKRMKQSNSKSIFETHPLKASIRINLHFHKGILLGFENSLAEKYESLMQLKLISNNPANYKDVEKILDLYLKEVDLDSRVNLVILSDICDLIIAKQYCNLKPNLEEILNKTNQNANSANLTNNYYSNPTNVANSVNQTNPSIPFSQINQTNQTISNSKNLFFVIQQLKNTITILKFVNQSQFKFNQDYKQSDAKKSKKLRKDSNLELKKKYKTKSNFMTKPNSIQTKYFTENKINFTKRKKSTTRNENSDSNDEYNFTEMNEVSDSKNNIKKYENQMPRRILKDLGNYLNLSQNNESCNVADSSISILKNEKSWDVIKDEYDHSDCDSYYDQKNLRVIKDKFKPSEKLFASIPPKKVDSIFFECDDADFENITGKEEENKEKI